LEASRRIGNQLPSNSDFKLKDWEMNKYIELLEQTLSEMRTKLHSHAKDSLGNFVKHQMCVNAMATQVSRCLPKATEVCQSSSLHVAKVLRLRFDELEELTFLYPNLKIVFFPRDPRGIAYSRAQTDLVKNKRHRHYIEEARFVCMRMRSDLIKKNILVSRYPNKVLTVSYEYMARHPMEYAEQVFKHLGKTVPSGWKDFITANSKAKVEDGPFGMVRKDPLKTALSWKRRINRQGKLSMTKTCRSVLEELNYDVR
jgi:hypothetical protein